MFADRLLVTIVLLPIGLLLIVLGGWAYAGMIGVVLALAAREYVQLFRSDGHRPGGAIVIGGVLALAAGRMLDGFASAGWLISLIVLGSMAYHLWEYERGRQAAATDLAVTLLGVFYLGWIGAYFISLRALPEGKWWVLLTLPCVWFADSFAYAVGRQWGRHKLCPRLSPKKTWEGYLAGIVGSVLGGALMAFLWQFPAGAGTAINPARGALLGLAMGIFPVLGDLGESMIKRQIGVKDSGKLLPGHGGVFDRIDSWLWAAVLGYYLITALWL